MPRIITDSVNSFPIICGLLLLLSACHLGKNPIKEKILSKVPSSKEAEIELDINTLSAVPITSLCVQTPYLTRQEMEKRIGHKLDMFNEVDDRFFVLWLFKGRQPPTKITFHRWHELNLGSQPHACAKTAKIKILNSHLYLTGAN